MGFFSFITNDSKRSVIIGQRVNIYLIDNRGNVYTEKQYGGYGKFGGKDIFILFAEMNNLTLPFYKTENSENEDDEGDETEDNEGEDEKNEDDENEDSEDTESSKIEKTKKNKDSKIKQLRSYAINKWYHSNNSSQLKIGDSIEWFPNDEYIYPNIVENCKSKWVNKMPKDCPEQGAWP